MEDWQWFGDSNLSKGQETKLRIMKSAIQLFSQSGFSNVTLKDIAGLSKTSHPLILKHFESKENLLLAVRKLVTFSNHRWVDSKIKVTMSGKERLFTHCFENINWGFHNSEQAKIILLTYYYGSLENMGVNPGVNAIAKGNKRILAHVLQAKREKLIRSGESPEFIADMTHEFTIGLYTKMLLDQVSPKKIPSSYKKKLNLFLDRFF